MCSFLTVFRSLVRELPQRATAARRIAPLLPLAGFFSHLPHPPADFVYVRRTEEDWRAVVNCEGLAPLAILAGRLAAPAIVCPPMTSATISANIERGS